MGLGARLKSLLAQRKMSIKELHERTGIPVNTLYSITKRNNQSIRSENLRRIALALEVNPARLLGELDEKTGRLEGDMTTSIWQSMETLGAGITYEGEILNQKEQDLLMGFRRLNIEGQEEAIREMDKLGEIQRYIRVGTPSSDRRA